MADKLFPADFNDRGTVKITDKLIINNIDTGITEYTTVAALFAAILTNPTFLTGVNLLCNLKIGTYTFIGNKYSASDTWIGQNVYPNFDSANEIKLGSSFITNGASVINIGFNGLTYYQWSAGDLAGKVAGDTLTLPAPSFSVNASGDVTIAGDLDIGGTTTGLTKAMVALGDVDNTSDADKPISTLTQNALNAKQNTITGGTDAPTGGNDGDVYFQYEELA